MKRYLKNVVLIFSIIALFVAFSVLDVPNQLFSYTYALAEKYVFTTKDEVPSFTVGNPTLVPGTKSDGTKYDKMYVDKLGEIRVPVTRIENVPDKNDFNVKVTRNGTDVTSNFVITKTNIANKSMTITLAMKEGGTYNPSSYVVTVSVNHEWEESKDSETTTESRVKIMRNSSIGNLPWNSNSPLTNDWNKASIQAILNGRYYNATGAYDEIGLTEEAKNLISNINWNIGAHAAGSGKASDFYTSERGTRTYGSNSSTWQGNVGLMYPSDYGFAVGGSEKNSCLNTSVYNYSSSCKNANWLYSNSDKSTMTHTLESSGTGVFYITHLGDMGSYEASKNFATHPVVYLDKDVVITGGNGSENNPYTIKKSAVTTNNMVQRIKSLANTDTTNLTTDGTTDNNVRYVGSNPNNYVEFNGELWRIIGVMNNVEGNDGENLEAKNNTISRSTNFALVDKYYNFEGKIETKTNYPNNPRNKRNRWEIVLDSFEGVSTSSFSYTLTDSRNRDYTSYFNISVNETNSKITYTIGNKTSILFRAPSGTYTVTVNYSNPTYSDSRGTLTKRFTFTLGGKDVIFNEATPVESHQYVRTPSTTPVTLQVTKLTNSSIVFREGTETKTMSIEEFNKAYSGTAIQDIRHVEDGDVVFSFTYDDKNYFIYRVTSTAVYYIDLESEVTDSSGNLVDHFNLSKEDFENQFPNQLTAFEESKYSTDGSGDVYYPLNANKSIVILTIQEANKIINAGGGGVFYFKYNYSGMEREDFDNVTYRIFNTNGKEVTQNDGFVVKDIKVTTSDSESGQFAYTLDYNNTDESYVGEYYVRFYMNDGHETITRDIGFSLYEGEIDYYINHTVDSTVFTKHSNKQINHYLGFYLRKGSVQATTINYHNVNVKIYDSLVDMDDNGELYYYDLINYEVRILNKKDNNVTYKVFEDDKEVGTFTTTIEEFKKSKYSQVAELLDYYKFDATTGNIITDSTNFKENSTTSIEVISARFSNELKDQVLVFKENGVQKESTYTDFKASHPNMYGYLFLNFVFDEDGNILVGRLLGNYRANAGTKVGHEVTDQFNIMIDESGTNLDHAVVVLPNTEVDPKMYYAYVAYENLPGVGHLNDDPDTLITKAEFPEMWKQNTHMTMMDFDEPEYEIEFALPKLSNDGDANDIMYDNIEGTATFDLKISDTFKFENKYSYAIYYTEDTEGNIDEINWGTPIQTDKSTSKMFNVNSEIFSMIERTELEPLETTLTVGTIKGVAHPKGRYKIVLSYTNNGVTNTGEQTFEIDGKYYGLVLDKEKTDDLSFILNFPQTKSMVFDGYYISNYDNINIRMIQENSSGDIELTREKTDNNSGKFKIDNEDKFTYQIEREEVDDTHSIYTFKLTNIKDKPQSAPYHLYFTYKEDGGDEARTTVDFVVNPASYEWEVSEEDVPTANGAIQYFTKEINTTYIEDLNQFEFKIMGFNGNDYVDVSSDESKNKEFDSVELIDKECSGLDCTAKVKITLKEDTDKKKNYYLVSEYLNKDDETPISDLEALFAWDIERVRITGSYYDPVENKDHVVDGFFKNVEDTTIDITLDTVRTDAVNWELNRSCLDTGYNCEVNNEGTTKYNDFLTEVSNGNKHLKLRVNTEHLNTHKDELKVQKYALVLYFGSQDYKIYTLEVHGNYVLVKFGNSLIYSTTTGADGQKNVDGLFKNKNGFIYAPVTLIGVDYDDPGVNISLKNANGNIDYLGRPFEFDREQFNKEHVIDIRYLARSADIAIAQDYYLMIEYNNGEETFTDRLPFRLNEKYFNYEISVPSYDPNPLIPNKGGKITFRVTTEDIPRIQFGINNQESLSEKYVMMQNAQVLNNRGEDVTSEFTKSVVNAEGNNSFDLTLAFAEGAAAPGDYTLKMSYELEGYTLEKEKAFSIGNYAKELEISRVEIISKTTDNRMHKNVDGTYRLHFESAYNINPGFIVVNVFNGETNITNKFNVSVQDHHIDIAYSASTNLDAGDYNVVITYQDDDMPEAASTVTQGIKLYGNYKQIDLSNLNSSASIIYADREEQYYTFDVNKQPIADDLANLKWIVTDAEGANVTDKFKITNNLGNTDAGDNVRVEIVPFALPVGTYHVRLYLLEEGAEDIDVERMYSNIMDISIDDTYYKINMNNTSTLSQVKNYDTSDKTSIYDRDGAKGLYHFTSTYPLDDLSKYTIAITDTKGKIIKEIDAKFINNDGTITGDFTTGALSDIGDYKVMICINHLPYTGLNMKVVKFIPVTKVTLKINNTNASASYTAYTNTTYKTTFVVEPNNATNKNFTLKSSNTNVATISGTNIVTKNGGSSTITLSNGDTSVSVTFNVQDRLSSSVYTINHTDKTIFVSFMSKKQLTKTEFMGNIRGYTSYQILNSSNQNITNNTNLIGTNMGLKVSGVTYKIIVIGDVNGDGKITNADITQLHRHVRKAKLITNKYQLKAAAINKRNTISNADTTKLFRFVRNAIASI